MTHTLNPQKDILLTAYNSISLYQIGADSLEEFSKFVFDRYAYHYSKKHAWSPDEGDLEEMIESDKAHFKKSFYLAFKNDRGQILGTLKATLKDGSISFPIENEFNLNLEEEVLTRGIYTNSFWHYGRLAIHSQELREMNIGVNSREVFKQLFIHGFKMISNEPGNHMIAESDALIYDLFHEMHINMQTLGEAKDYLGSPTYPVIITSHDIFKWLESHGEVVPQPALA